uniref:DUF7149 domain-containing protein n=1 Tax=Arthrobacter sp. TaxID=1667 RepID=UPI00159803E7|nr:TaqI-like C-terminal specificity domain-containing protein [Arthrobacter sp.]QJS06528.1 type IIG restriction enzyme and methyltransferase [Arthrobacter sp.]
MAIKGLSLKGSMNKNVQAIMPIEEEKNKFKDQLINYLKALLDSKNESEEFQKNLLKFFLEDTLPNNFINTSNRIDLAIYNGKDSTSSLGVIFEVKSLSNKHEMMTKERINSKALQEMISYYLYERIVNKNLEIKKCIITNGFSWFVFESKEIEKYFYKNKELIDLYNKFRKNQLSGNTTDFLYKEVISPAIDKAIEKGITIAHFDLENALISKNPIKLRKSNVTQLYRFFSSENLLNKEIFTDSNKLNKVFYDELLYIMGLTEVKKGSSKVIARLKEDKRQDASLVENSIDRLNIIKDVPVDKQFDAAVQLSVIWMNRLLFLKLLESQLVSFNNDKKYEFLIYDKLSTYEDIYDLFFGVLAKPVEKRSQSLKNKFEFIPYLNSSLFEESQIEKSREGISIGRLRESEIVIYNKTILKGVNGKRKVGTMNFLEYLFEFLNSYDFSTSVSHNINSKNDLINASVLGLIFEKINGYREGSFFTPGKITMYMSRKAVRTAAIDKVNSELEWHCKNIDDLKFEINNIEIAKKVSDIIDSLKICDPAVGSGHFLVSVLNEVIALKSELNTLFDAEGKILQNIHCYVTNDELVIQDFNGDNFYYHAGNIASERIQKAFFLQKQTIIENCLFGVDINPNSANICRLRLWIELLKNSYYELNPKTKLHELITLPNIDINIKVGDSLLHKFGFDSEFDMRRKDFKEYLGLVKEYKKTNNKQTKAEIYNRINNIKLSFDTSFSTPELKRLSKLTDKMGKAGQFDLFGGTEKDKALFEELETKKIRAQKEVKKAMNNSLFNSGIEWRIEFPEILGVDGEFIGFDLVIGNPPYIFARNQSFTEDMKEYYIRTYSLSEYQANTYTIFIELAHMLMRKGGTFSYIIPNNFLTIQSTSKVRKFIVNKCSDVILINSLDKIFADASVDNCIIFFKKNKPNWIEVAELKSGEFNTIGRVEPDFFGKTPIFSISMVKYKDAVEAFWKVNEFSGLNRPEIATIGVGIEAYRKDRGKPKQKIEDVKNRIYHSNIRNDESYVKYLEGKNVSRYLLSWNGEWIKYGEHLSEPRPSVDFNQPRILVRQIPSHKTYAIEATYTDEYMINDRNSNVIGNIQVNPFFLLGIINSKIITLWFIMKFDKFQRRVFPQFKANELGEFPIPDATLIQQEEIAALVKTLMNEMEKENINISLISELNIDIDELVMELFELTNEEKQRVRSFHIEK